MHPEAGTRAGRRVRPDRLDPDEALVREGLDPVHEIDAQAGIGVGHRERRLERPAAREHAEPREEAPLDLREQVVAPRDGAAERSLALGQVACPATEVQAPVEPVQDLAGRQDPHARRGELQREGQAAEPFRDRAHGGERVVAEREVRSVGSCPVEEQGRALVGVERRHVVGPLAADPEQLAARHEHMHLWRSPDETGNQIGHRGQQLLEVVEHEQGRALAEVTPERLARCSLG